MRRVPEGVAVPDGVDGEGGVMDLEAIKARAAAVTEQTGDWREWARRLGESQADVPALVAEIERLRAIKTTDNNEGGQDR